MFRHALLNLMIPAALAFGATAASAESRLALVIGQSAYQSVPGLPNPVNDAKAISQMLTDSGFEVLQASDLTQKQMRDRLSEFAGKIAAKGPDTIALMFYAGHGLQIDGENFLVPVDIAPKRQSDIPIQAVRLNDVLNTLTSAPSKMRILLLDACRNNPFPDIAKDTGGGLAIIDTKFGAPNTFLSFSTSPGAVAEDGKGDNSPYTSALLATAREPNLPIEETFKRVRVSVNKTTDGRQTPWDSSSLTEDFRFTGTSAPGPKLASTKRSVEEWTRDLKGKPVETANETIVADGSDESYEAFAKLYADTPLGKLAADWLDRHRRMVAWNNAVLANTSAAFGSFLTRFPDSDLAPTARTMEERLRNRPEITPVVAGTGAAQTAALTCPCNAPAAPQPKKADGPKRVDSDAPKRVDRAPRRERQYYDDDDVPARRAPRDTYERGYGGGGYGYGGRGRY